MVLRTRFDPICQRDAKLLALFSAVNILESIVQAKEAVNLTSAVEFATLELPTGLRFFILSVNTSLA
jgi:hypothetical protein